MTRSFRRETLPKFVPQISQALEEAGIEYKISDDGMRLMTTSENVGRARIVTAGTTSTAGMEMLDSIQLSAFSPARTMDLPQCTSR